MSFAEKVVTIERHIIEGERLHQGATGDFSGLLRDLTLAIKIVWREVSRAGLVDILGTVGRENIHGDQVKKLDVFADEHIYRAMDHGGHLCILGSEENELIMDIPERHPIGKYVLLYDPLDGSSNIDANVNLGTVFSVHLRLDPESKEAGTLVDCLQPGHRQVAAGYVLYGPSTMFIYTTGHGVHGFTLDPSIGEFLLSFENIQTPKRGSIYSVNEGNRSRWDTGVKRYLDYLKEEDGPTGRPYSSRYIGSMVADFHRTLLYGGIFMYPGDAKNPRGKLRLLYEAAPLAFIAEEAGGTASDGWQRILDIEPGELHQRTPLFIGSAEDVGEAEEFVQVKR
jgi:fructose-1,6-bisphosphatase I